MSVTYLVYICFRRRSLRLYTYLSVDELYHFIRFLIRNITHFNIKATSKLFKYLSGQRLAATCRVAIFPLLMHEYFFFSVQFLAHPYSYCCNISCYKNLQKQKKHFCSTLHSFCCNFAAISFFVFSFFGFNLSHSYAGAISGISGHVVAWDCFVFVPIQFNSIKFIHVD